MADASLSQHVDTGLEAVTNCKADVYGPQVDCNVPGCPISGRNEILIWCCPYRNAAVMHAVLTACTAAQNSLPRKVHFCDLIRPVPLLQGIQHLGSAMGCFMRMKGINFRDIDTAPASQSSSSVTGSQDVRNTSVLPTIIQSEAVSISPVVVCPASTPVNTDMANPNKRQKTEDTTAKAVSHSRQILSASNYVPVSVPMQPLPQTV